MTRVVFRAVNAWNWDPSDVSDAKFSRKEHDQTDSVDASRRPKGGREPLPWYVDDRDVGATSVERLGENGGVYVESTYAIGKKFPLPPEGFGSGDKFDYSSRKYEFLTVQYTQDHPTLGGARFYGFHALWYDGDTSAALMFIFNAGDSLQTDNRFVQRLKVDLTNSNVVLPASEHTKDLNYPQPIRGASSGGALFIRCREVNARSLHLPKLPQSAVDGKIPTCPAGET